LILDYCFKQQLVGFFVSEPLPAPVVEGLHDLLHECLVDACQRHLLGDVLPGDLDVSPPKEK